MLTKPEQIKTWLQESVDEDYYDSRFRMEQKAFDPAGEQGLAGGKDTGSEFPDYPDLKAMYKESGVSNQILQAQIVTMSRILRAVPEPEFPDLNEFDSEVRKAFWKVRNSSYGSSQQDGFVQLQKAWMDGDGLGMGFVQFGLVTNPKSGHRRVSAKHVPIKQMIWDRYARSFCDAGMACSMTYLPLHKAREIFGKKADKYIYLMTESNSKTQMQMVRVFEYHDMGYEGSEPTMAIILGDITNDPISIKPNVYGCLPYGHYEHILLPGMRRAIGRVDLLVSDQDALNTVERAMRQESKRVGFDIVSADLLNPEKLADVEAGIHGTVVTSERPMETGDVPYTRVPAGEISTTTLAYYQNLQDSFRANAGMSELDQGNDVEGADTLGEVQLVDQRSQTQSNWSVFQTARYFQRCVSVFCKVAQIGDDEPAMLDVLGANVEINNGDPNMDIAVWLEEPSDVIVSEESLMKGDLERERVGKMARLNALLPEVQSGLVDPIAYAEEKIKALGYDPKKFLTMYQQEAQMPGQAVDPATGQPMQQQVA